MTGSILAARLIHPSWWPRIIRSTITTWWLWREQGCPRDVPVVIRPGRLIVLADGHASIDGWYFDFRYQLVPVRADDLWDRLSAQYPVERANDPRASMGEPR